MSPEFRVDTTSLESARSGVIWGAVWWELGDQRFPEFKWNDLAVAVAVETLVAIRDVFDGANLRRRVRFFDGPFWVDFTRDRTDEFSIAFGEKLTVGSDGFEFGKTTRQIQAVCHNLLTECKARGWGEQDDVRRLASVLTP